jgi:hypothetical protein
MRALIVAVILTLALGLTVKDMASGSSAEESVEHHAAAFDESANVSETGNALREWLLEKLHEAESADH